MGGGYSQFKEAKFPGTKPPMFAMSLTGRPTALKETILLTYCPPDVRSNIQDTINILWPKGIKKEEEINASCYRIKLNNYPFEASYFPDVIQVKHMMGVMIARIGRLGWLPLVGCDTQSHEDVSTIIFYRGGSPIFTSLVS